MLSINKEYIDDLLKYGEHLNLECKESKNELPKSIWSTYSAFANTASGYILLGIEETSTLLKKIKEMLTKLQQSGYTSYWT